MLGILHRDGVLPAIFRRSLNPKRNVEERRFSAALRGDK